MPRLVEAHHGHPAHERGRYRPRGAPALPGHPARSADEEGEDEQPRHVGKMPGPVAADQESLGDVQGELQPSCDLAEEGLDVEGFLVGLQGHPTDDGDGRGGGRPLERPSLHGSGYRGDADHQEDVDPRRRGNVQEVEQVDGPTHPGHGHDGSQPAVAPSAPGHPASRPEAGQENQQPRSLGEVPRHGELEELLVAEVIKPGVHPPCGLIADAGKAVPARKVEPVDGPGPRNPVQPFKRSRLPFVLAGSGDGV